MKIKKIIVPLDGSTLAEMAVPAAVELAREHGAAVVLVRAAEASWITPDVVEAEVMVVREAEEYLEKVAARLRAEGAPAVETAVWYGTAASSIVEAAEAQRADLIVMTSHGRSGIGRLILGSVAESVLRGTSVPILLLRATSATVLPPVGRTRQVEPAGS